MKSRAASSAALVALVCSTPALAQSSITRVLNDSRSDADLLEEGPITASQFTGTPTGVGIGTNLAVIPALAGVSLTQVDVDVAMLIVADLRLRGLDPAGTRLSGLTNVQFGACNSICTWGPLDTGFVGASFGIPNSQPALAQGEVRSFQQALLVQPAAATYTPGHPLWSALLANPDFYANAGHSGLSWSAINTNGAPTQIAVERQDTSSIVDIGMTVYVRYDEAPLFTTCTAPPNSTGVPGRVSAYGSREAGQDWLIVRGSDLPDQQLAVLFAGTQNALVPFQNYNLCLGGVITREGMPHVSAGGVVDFDLNLTGRIRGDSVYLQVFHRDPILGLAATSAAAFFVE